MKRSYRRTCCHEGCIIILHQLYPFRYPSVATQRSLSKESYTHMRSSKKSEKCNSETKGEFDHDSITV